MLAVSLDCGHGFGVAAGERAASGRCRIRATLETPELENAAGPTVLIDAAHLNFHTADGGYAPFARLLRRDGYRVRANDAPFGLESLSSARILVIANAMHKDSEADWAPLPSHSAFTAEEIAEAEKWVRDGGSLLLIADHMPLAGHAEALAAAFGVRFQNGFAFDSARNGQLTFRRADGSRSSFPNGRRVSPRRICCKARSRSTARAASPSSARPRCSARNSRDPIGAPWA